jgi:hypothetical protein
MTMLTRLLALLTLTVFLAPSPSRAARSTFVPLTPADQQIAFKASQLAPGHPLRALGWLNRASRVDHAEIGHDGVTIEISFRDGSTVVLLPSTVSRVGDRSPLPARLAARPHLESAGSARAVVLEPFADELGLGPSAGQSLADQLTAAGFSVDVYRNDQVTVPVMENLSQYSVVYMLTHSGVLDNGHALVLLGETDAKPYAALLKDCDSETPRLCSVMQGIAQGSTALSVAITDYFFQTHMGSFPNSSMFFLNGCEILSAPAFVAALHSRNLASLVGWDGKVDSAITELSAQIFFNDLISGSTVEASLSDVAAKGFATSVWDNQTAHLRDDGDGGLTLSDALTGAPPTLSTTTPTATPLPATATPTPKPSKACPKYSKKKHGKCTCKTGYKMKKGKCVKKK